MFERSRAVAVDDGEPCRVRTDTGGEVIAADVLVLTHYPTLDRGLFFARLAAERSYAVGARVQRARAGRGCSSRPSRRRTPCARRRTPAASC